MGEPTGHNQDAHIRGSRLSDRTYVSEQMEQLRSPGDPGLYWGGLHLPSEDGVRHFCVMGTTGSGKTVLIQMLMQSVLTRIGKKKPIPVGGGVKKKSNSQRAQAVDEPSINVYHKFLNNVCVILILVSAVLLMNTSRGWFYVDMYVDKASDLAPIFIIVSSLVIWFTTRATLSSTTALIGLGGLYGGCVFAKDTMAKACVVFMLLFLIWMWTKRIIQGVGATLFLFPLTMILESIKNGSLEASFAQNNKEFFENTMGMAVITGAVSMACYYHPKYSQSDEPQADAPVEDEDATPAHHLRRHRALIYDGKRDSVSRITAINPECKIIILNPFDTRCASWDMAKDITKPSTADQVATILIPDDKHAQQKFYPNAARLLLSGVFKALMHLKPGEWDFRDVILACKSRENLAALLGQSDHTKDLVAQLFGNDDTFNNIFSEIATRMGPYEHIAAAWSRCQEKVSLVEWLNEESILVLGNDDSHRAGMDAVNRLIFQRLTETLLAGPETNEEQTWMFLDEIAEAGNLELLSRLLNKGRSKGACVVLGFQNIDGMREVYGDKMANSIVGECNHMAILRLNSPETAQWASDRIGQFETMDEDISFQEGESTGEQTSKSKGKTRTPGWFFSPVTAKNFQDQTSATNQKTSSKGVSRKKSIKATVLASEFMTLPLTNAANGLSGFFLVPQVEAGAYRAKIPGAELFPKDPTRQALVAPDKKTPNFVERPATDEYLDPWTPEELTIFGLRSKIAPAPATEDVEPQTQSDTPAPAPKRRAKPRLRNVRPNPVPQADEADVERLHTFLNRSTR